MNRRTFARTLAGGAFLTAATASAGLGRARAAAPIRLGVFVPQSGPAGLFGPSSKNCTTLAVEKINAAGGVLGRPLEVEFADAGAPPADVRQTALRLWKGSNVDGFIGMHDSAVRGALTSVFAGQVPYIYTAVYEGGECARGTYVLGETPAQQLAPVVPWLARTNHVKRWYLIGNDYNWPRETNKAARAYVQRSGGTVVGEEYLPFSVDNFDSSIARIKRAAADAVLSSIARIKRAAADAVLITLVGGASVTFNRAFAGFGLSDSVVRLGTLIEENTLAGIGAANARNLYSSAAYFSSVRNPPASALARAYAARFGAGAAPLNDLGESCYEGVLLFHALAERAKSLQVADFERVASGTSYTGPRGTVTLRADHHAAQNIYLARAQAGKFTVADVFEQVAPGKNCA